jgi:hypothetical protein
MSANIINNYTKKHVLSTTVQILDVITSCNCNCHPTAAILFRYRSNGSRDFTVSIYLEVTSHQTFRVRLPVTLCRHLSQPYSPYSIETKDVITSKIRFKHSQQEHYKIHFIICYKLHNAEISQLDVAKVLSLIQGKVWFLSTIAFQISSVSVLEYTLQPTVTFSKFFI